MSLSSNVVNEALQLIGFDGNAVTGSAPTFDTSTAGQSAALFYNDSIAAVTRLHQWDFARTTAPLVLSGNPAPFPWSYEFIYPEDCVQLWQVTPQTIADVNNPAPSDWVRGVNIIGSIQQSVIWTNVSLAQAIYAGSPTPASWDPVFRANVILYLASRFAVSLLGKPDLAQSLFEQVGTMTQIGSTRSDT